jgi:hypothetical protein
MLSNGRKTMTTRDHMPDGLHINGYNVQALGPTGPIPNNVDC